MGTKWIHCKPNPTLLEDLRLLIFEVLLGEQEIRVQVQVPAATGLKYLSSAVGGQSPHN